MIHNDYLSSCHVEIPLTLYDSTTINTKANVFVYTSAYIFIFLHNFPTPLCSILYCYLPPYSIFVHRALDCSLKKILALGMEEVFDIHLKTSTAFKAAVKSLGLTLVRPLHSMHVYVQCFCLPVAYFLEWWCEFGFHTAPVCV